MNAHDIFISHVLSSGSTLVSKARLVSLHNICQQFRGQPYSFVECGVAKGGCLATMKYSAGDDNQVFGFDSFDGMPETTPEDIDPYNKSDPHVGFGKVGDNLSGGIQSVFNTFQTLGVSMDNVKLIKGYFKDSLAAPTNIDAVGKIAVLRLDGDWYESTKICLEKFYDKVIDGGVIIIDDYGHFIGAKQATDEFRVANNIVSPLIQTDYTEHYWIKRESVNIHEDIWTCSDEMRHDIADFFKDKSHYKLAEIGAHKGYSTRILSQIFSQVYAVDNSVEWTNFSKNFNRCRANIEYVMLDIYKGSWEILPADIDVSFIDAMHTYDTCRSDILNSMRQFKALKYIVFDDYGVWPGVRNIIDELLSNKILVFERFIGLTDVPGPSGIVPNTHEGIICSIAKHDRRGLENKTYSWQNHTITFLENGMMDAFGYGYYTPLDTYTFKAIFGWRQHTLVFNEDYSEFVSTRSDDNDQVIGRLCMPPLVP